MNEIQPNADSVLTSLTDQIQPADTDIELMKRVLATAGARPDLIPTPLLAYLADYLGGAGNLNIGTNQIAGFARFSPQITAVVGAGTFENTASRSYTDLATVGPSLTQLPPGYYLVIPVAGMLTTIAANRALMSVSINGSTPNDSDAAYTEATNIVRCLGISQQKLTAGSNTITAKYKSISGTTAQGQFTDRQIFALRYANL